MPGKAPESHGPARAAPPETRRPWPPDQFEDIQRSQSEAEADQATRTPVQAIIAAPSPACNSKPSDVRDSLQVFDGGEARW